jgi:hypothetical protein
MVLEYTLWRRNPVRPPIGSNIKLDINRFKIGHESPGKHGYELIKKEGLLVKGTSALTSSIRLVWTSFLLRTLFLHLVTFLIRH